MKSFIKSGLCAMLFFSAIFLHAQNDLPDQKNNYVVLTTKVEQIKPIVLTALSLAKEDGDKFGDFQIILCGKTVKKLMDKLYMEKYLKLAADAQVSIHVCGFSLNKFGINREELPEMLHIVKNGILYDFNLQKKGYLSIEL